MNKTWTPEAVIEDMKRGIKMFGTYTFSDKGPYETMDYHSQVSYLKTLSAQELHDFIKKLRGKTKSCSNREYVCSALLAGLDDGPWTDEEWDFICEASPGSYT